MIFCLYGAFLENSLSKQNVPSPHVLAVCMQGEGESLSFFLGLAALCMVLLRRFQILLGRRKSIHLRIGLFHGPSPVQWRLWRHAWHVDISGKFAQPKRHITDSFFLEGFKKETKRQLRPFKNRDDFRLSMLFPLCKRTELCLIPCCIWFEK